MSNSQIHVLIAAAGAGTRFDDNNNPPKQYQILNGKSILERSIKNLLKINNISTLTCIINPKNKKYHDVISTADKPKYVNGGKTRKESIFKGLSTLINAKNEDIVIIHDGARPLTSQKDIEQLLSTMDNARAATLATPVSDTLRRENNGDCADIVTREGLWAIQTPQAFRYTDLLKAHQLADKNTEYTDDTSLVSAIGIKVKLVHASAENFKITTKDDFKMAEKLLSSQSKTRTGLGFDVHAFDTDSKGPIRICGIDIDHPHKLKGHSDADVGLHAITDAILGAIGEGDIGQHFPPSDNTYKNMDSAVFLEKAMKMLEKHNGTINNIDVTLICEEPKIGPHVKRIRNRIATIMRVDEKDINVKATTSEQLGFTGRKEGIAAQAIATVTIHA